MTEGEVEDVVKRLHANDARALIVIGGNGSMRAAAALAKFDISVIGVPKTIDNDIVGTDRCPGFGSAARYVAQSVRDLGMDVSSLPQPVSLYETMGRSVGWLAGAAALAKIDEDHAPHLIYLPERTFDVNEFLGNVDRIVSNLGWCVAVLSEGVRTADGRP